MYFLFHGSERDHFFPLGEFGNTEYCFIRGFKSADNCPCLLCMLQSWKVLSKSKPPCNIPKNKITILTFFHFKGKLFVLKPGASKHHFSPTAASWLSPEALCPSELQHFQGLLQTTLEVHDTKPKGNPDFLLHCHPCLTLSLCIAIHATHIFMYHKGYVQTKNYTGSKTVIESFSGTI